MEACGCYGRLCYCGFQPALCVGERLWGGGFHWYEGGAKWNGRRHIHAWESRIQERQARSYCQGPHPSSIISSTWMEMEPSIYMMYDLQNEHIKGIQVPVLYQFYWTTSGYGNGNSPASLFFPSFLSFFVGRWRRQQRGCKLPCSPQRSEQHQMPRLKPLRNPLKRFHWAKIGSLSFSGRFFNLSPCCAGSKAHRYGRWSGRC